MTEDVLTTEAIEKLEFLVWRLLNNISGYKEEPVSYHLIRMMDAVIGVMEALASVNSGYEPLLREVMEAKDYLTSDEDAFMAEINRLILEHAGK